MLQEKWQNKAHIYIRQYVNIENFENIDIKQVFYTKVVRKYWFKCYKWDFRHKR